MGAGSRLGSQQPRRFRESAQNIHALDRLARRALDDVVLGAQDDETTRARIQPPRHLEDIRADDILRIGQRRVAENANERFGLVRVAITLSDPSGHGLRRPILAGPCDGRKIQRGQDAAIHRDQVGRELDLNRFARGEAELLLDFRQVPVFRNAIRAEALVALAEEIVGLRLATRPADSAQ